MIGLIGAYALWGLLPLYVYLLQHLPAWTLLVQRTLWAWVILAVMFVWHRYHQRLRGLPYRRLLASAALLSTNWGLYVYAIVINDPLSASLAYFICPSFTMLLALILFNERLSGLQWLAMIAVAIGIAYRIWMDGLPLLALAIALSWAGYAAVQKKDRLPAMLRLSVETSLVLPIFLVASLFIGAPFANFDTLPNIALQMGLGAATIAPLMLFVASAKGIDFKWVSILQYIAPSLIFINSALVFEQAVSRDTLVAFVWVWVGVALFCASHIIKK